jgi:hypothetical protein
MRAAKAALLVLAASLFSAGAATALVPASGAMTASFSTLRAGAFPVSITLQLRYEMQCGYPGPGPVVVRFPADERVPSAFAAGSVQVDGRTAAAVSVPGKVVRIALPPRPQVMCDVIGPGRLTITFLRTAAIGNPPSVGRHTIVAGRQGLVLQAGFTTRAA